MKYLLKVSLCAFLFLGVLSCKNKKTNDTDVHSIFLVRHAEKADDGTKDPGLTSEGIMRSERLADMMKYEDITRIYATNYKRTKETADPLATRNEIDVLIYEPSDMSFARKIKNESKDHNILIIGHSNTTPSLVNSIIGTQKYEKIEEDDYSNLFVIEQRNNQFTATKRSY